jgi:hypothetical protein
MKLMDAMPKPNFRNRLISKDQTTGDIVKLILECEKKSRIYIPKIENFFKGGNDLEKCKRVWYFLRKNILYIKESPDRQTGKLINRFLYDKFGDCKHFSIFSACILNYFGVPVKFRLVSFDSKKSPTHIYCVAEINGKEVIVDGCIDNFGQESNYSSKIDVSLLN